MKILYIACEPNVGNLFLPIALAARKLYPGAENILIDPANVIFESYRSDDPPTLLFRRHGFQEEKPERNEFSDLQNMSNQFKSYLFYLRLFKRIKPSVVVVPHELGYAFYAVQVAKLMGIPSYHVQHGIWGPSKFDDYYAAKDTGEQEVQTDLSRRSVLLRHYGRLKEKVPIIRHTAACLNKRVVSIMNKGDNKKEPHIPEELMLYKDKVISPKEYYPINADRMAVFGPYYKRQLRDKRPEFGEDRIDVVGFLRGDNFRNNPIEPPEVISERYQLDMSGRLAIYFYSPFQEFPQYYEITYDTNDALVDAVSILKELDENTNILVLLHPNFRFNYYRDKLVDLLKHKDFTKVQINRTHNDHFSLYRLSSIVLGVKSATLYEAMLVNVPVVVQAYILSRIHEPQHIEAGAVAPVFSPLHLREQIKRALTDNSFKARMYENQKMVCQDLLGSFDGKCGERVATAIAGLIR